MKITRKCTSGHPCCEDENEQAGKEAYSGFVMSRSMWNVPQPEKPEDVMKRLDARLKAPGHKLTLFASPTRQYQTGTCECGCWSREIRHSPNKANGIARIKREHKKHILTQERK